jgi:hypothetical protein
MPITVAWDNAEQTILRYDFEESWTLTEFAQIRRVGYEMIDTVSHQGYVGILLVLPKRGVIPDN